MRVNWDAVSTAMLEIAVGLTNNLSPVANAVTSGFANGDFNESGSITAADALDAAKFGAGLLPVGSAKTRIENIFEPALIRAYTIDTVTYSAYILEPDFELDVSDYIEEAFERCGLEVRTGYDLKTARRSLNLMLADWANRGLNQWTIEQRTQPLSKGTGNYNLGTDLIDVLSASLRRSNTDYSMNRISRDEYLSIPSKATEARPTQFFVDRQITPEIKLWPVPENSTDVIVYDCLTRMNDADNYNNKLQMPFRFYPCLAAGLAYYIAIKKAPDRIQVLKAIYDEEFERAQAEDRDRASFSVTPNLQYYRVG